MENNLSEMFEKILESVEFGILVENEKREIVLVNPIFLRLFNISLSIKDCLATDCTIVANKARKSFRDEQGFVARMEQIIEKKKMLTGEILHLRDKRVFERHFYPIIIGNEYRGHAWIYIDISEKKDLEDKLTLIASKDELTQTNSRRKFHEELNNHLMLTRRYKKNLSLVMFDIDDFKQINDKYGHDAGDEVLQKIAKKTRENIRTVDVLGRWGGEEFLLLLPETDARYARKTAERIRRAIGKLRFDSFDGMVTASFGVTRYYRNDTDNDFIKRADKALYAAKQAGKNFVSVFGE